MDREPNGFSIRGSKGKVVVSTDFGDVRIQSPAGRTTFINRNGKLAFSGPNPHQIPYLGRGFHILFHGIGVFIDVTRSFRMPEVVDWVEGKSILEP